MKVYFAVSNSNGSRNIQLFVSSIFYNMKGDTVEAIAPFSGTKIGCTNNKLLPTIRKFKMTIYSFVPTTIGAFKMGNLPVKKANYITELLLVIDGFVDNNFEL